VRSAHGNSFDHLVGARQNRRWQVETERLRGFEIDHELIFVRRLDRQFGWLFALENAVDDWAARLYCSVELGP